MFGFRYALAALSIPFCMTVTSSNALAWGCVAVSVDTESDQTKWDDMTYGYSFRFNDQLEAQGVALQECVRRTDEKRTCKILLCESAY
jgi:hypothetical protein